MAVVNKYVDADLAADKHAVAAFNDGAKVYCVKYQFETVAADDDASIYRVCKNIPADWIPVSHEVLADTITGATDWDFGIYKTSPTGTTGAVIDADKLADGTDFSSGFARGSASDGIGNLGIDENQERIYELAGDTLETREAGYDLAWTANTAGSGAATIAGTILFVQG